MIYDENRLRSLLPKEVASLRVFDEIDSTSSEARRYAACGGSDLALFISDRQSGGRGRMGRSFYSPSGAGVYLSILLPQVEFTPDTLLLTTAAAVAVRRAALRVTGVDTDIKWVNDLYYRERKVCGILCEMLTEPRTIIIGVGVNLYASELPSEISGIAGALLDAPSIGVTREALAAAIVKEILDIRQELTDGAFMEEYRRHSAVLGREISYIQNGVAHTGRAVDINERGHLIVRCDNGEKIALSSGEISVRIK